MVALHVKTTAGKKVLESTVLQCKEALVASTEVPTSLQRLIHKGKVLKDDQTLESYGIQAEDTIYFVKGSAHVRPAAAASTAAGTPAPPTAAPSPVAAPAATTAPAANPFAFPLIPGTAVSGTMFGDLMGAGGSAMNMQQMQQQMHQQMMNNPEMVRQMMDSPMMQSVLNNPDIMRSIMQSNPAVQQLMEQNPQLNQIMNDPELLRQSTEVMRNPAAMREMMRSQDTALRNLESHPEGFNALRRMSPLWKLLQVEHLLLEVQHLRCQALLVAPIRRQTQHIHSRPVPLQLLPPLLPIRGAQQEPMLRLLVPLELLLTLGLL
ncbi:hypothetical protein PsorP6_005660 [Peronosclerospora sorghi]|uniref:Uncharacterized protein n=1 Tax=Peronosclerospora sorghi TaxID=230839 RepID=A0ACC0W3K7_9STRA|nr:hypothetical protein PsorP6_005660 [Peronosclerospora sorghi]